MKIKNHSLFVLAFVAIAGGATLLAGCGQSEPARKTELPEAAVSSSTPSKNPKAGLEALVGRWLRPDVGYLLEIGKVANDGKLDVVYSAPRLVQVGKAIATQEAGRIKVFIEIKDPSLAGSTYTMTFDAEGNRLNGVYFQAALGESSDIFFVRQ